VDFAGVVLPGDPEHDHPFRFDDAVEDPGVDIGGAVVEQRAELRKNRLDRR